MILYEERLGVDLPILQLSVLLDDHAEKVSDDLPPADKPTDGRNSSNLHRSEVSRRFEVEAVSITKACKLTTHYTIEQGAQRAAWLMFLADAALPRVHVLNFALVGGSQSADRIRVLGDLVERGERRKTHASAHNVTHGQSVVAATLNIQCSQVELLFALRCIDQEVAHFASDATVDLRGESSHHAAE